MAEAELHLIRQRLTGARLHKASKGELRLLVPVGLDYDKNGNIVLTGDEAVRAAIGEVFARFAALELGAPGAVARCAPTGQAAAAKAR